MQAGQEEDEGAEGVEEEEDEEAKAEEEEDEGKVQVGAALRALPGIQSAGEGHCQQQDGRGLALEIIIVAEPAFNTCASSCGVKLFICGSVYCCSAQSGLKVAIKCLPQATHGLLSEKK